jgi:hypothetical protein
MLSGGAPLVVRALGCHLCCLVMFGAEWSLALIVVCLWGDCWGDKIVTLGSVGGVSVTVLKISASCVMAWSCLSLRLENGADGARFCRAAMSSSGLHGWCCLWRIGTAWWCEWGRI